MCCVCCSQPIWIGNTIMKEKKNTSFLFRRAIIVVECRKIRSSKSRFIVHVSRTQKRGKKKEKKHSNRIWAKVINFTAKTSSTRLFSWAFVGFVYICTFIGLSSNLVSRDVISLCVESDPPRSCSCLSRIRGGNSNSWLEMNYRDSETPWRLRLNAPSFIIFMISIPQG